MNNPMKGVSAKAVGEKLFFDFVIPRGDQLRNEEWALQQQALLGYKAKLHGFFDFFLYEEGKDGNRVIKWWCFKKRQTDWELAPYRQIEFDRKKKKEAEAAKLIEDERTKKELEIEAMRKNKNKFARN